MNNNYNQEEYDYLTNKIRDLDVKELILLYIESRTGPLENRELIPLHLVFAIG